jgi:hypothetical protein
MGNNNSGGTTKPAVTVSKVDVTEKTNTKAKNDSSYDYLFKLLLVGDSGVGITIFCLYYLFYHLFVRKIERVASNNR